MIKNKKRFSRNNQMFLKRVLSLVEGHEKQLVNAVEKNISKTASNAFSSRKGRDTKAFGNRTKVEKQNLIKYSSRWFETMSDEDLKAEREVVRQAFCSCGNDYSKAGRLQNLLWRFDEELSKRAWGDEKPHAPSYHREHGWYLPNDD